MVSGHTQVFGLIGHPVKQSFSPFIQNMLADQMGIDMTYVTFDVDQGNLKGAMEGFNSLNIQGINVTVPYKTEIQPYLDAVQGEAFHIGAVNTLVREDHKLVGYNTDWIGLGKSLEHNKVDLKDQVVLIVGAGGSARAVAVMCALKGVKRIVITNRTKSKAEDISKLVHRKYDTECEVTSLEALKHIRDITLAFQTTPIGMYPHNENNPVYETQVYENLKVAVDLIYNPQETHFLREARLAGAKTINGLGMLFYQAVAAFELWHKVKVDEKIQDKCFKAFLQAINDKNE